MGLFDRLFKTDPHQALERAESLLERGQPSEALRLARRVLADNGSLAQDRRAETLRRRAEDALAEAALEKAGVAEASGYHDDAVEWIEAALDHVEDEGRRAELERRAAQLREAAEEARKVAGRIDFAVPADEEDEAAADAVSPGQELDPDSFYEALVGMLDDDVAERYEPRPAEFRRAYVALNEGRARDARPVLEELAGAHPDDPVYQLERGRARLMTADFEAALRDLEAVWRVFGDEPLDRAGSLSVPAMWAEAMLGAGRPGPMIERLDEVAVPSEGDQNLCHVYALGLMAAKRFDAAHDYLVEAMRHFSHPDFPHQLAAVLHALGRSEEAIDTLERAIAPSCSPAGCKTVPKHVGSFRSLAGLYLDRGRRLGRVEELLAHIAQAQDGRMEAQDYLLLAQYHRARGDAEAAEEAAARARELGPSPAAYDMK